MRTENEMMDLIFSVAEKIDSLKAIAMNGSRANQNASTDAFQDYDIVYFVTEDGFNHLIADRSWIEAFGPRLIMQTPMDFDEKPTKLLTRFNFLMLFSDGNRIDLSLCTLSEIDNWYHEDPLGKILWDPENLLPKGLVTTDEIYWVKEPSEKAFQECCNEFWWVATYVVKGICRNELLYASDHLYQDCYHQLLKLISWKVGATYRYQMNLGKNYKYLLDYLEDDEKGQLTKMMNMGSLKELSTSLILMERTFDATARQYAEEKHFYYHEMEAQNVMDYTLIHLY